MTLHRRQDVAGPRSPAGDPVQPDGSDKKNGKKTAKKQNLTYLICHCDEGYRESMKYGKKKKSISESDAAL